MKKFITVPLLGLILIGMFGSMAYASADDVIENPGNGNQYRGTIAGNETKNYMFNNRLRFQLQTNVSMVVDIESDCENAQDKNMSMVLNTTENRELTMKITNSNDELGLYNGSTVMAQNQIQYRFENQYIYNITLNGTDAVRAQLRTQADDPMATWAYLNEDTNEWVLVQSQYENGFVYANADHFSIWTVLSTLPGPNNVDVEHRFNGKVKANETNQFKFKNNFQFNFQANNSIEVDIECDTDTAPEKTMEMNMNTSEQIRLQIRVNGSNSELGLTNGSTIRTQNQYNYKFLEGAVFNFSSNGTEPFTAQLRYEVGEQNCTWAYYDEGTGEFVMVQSWVENGYVIADTDHFSIWTILTISEVEDTGSESIIPGYTFLGLFSLLGLAAIIYKKKH